VCSTLWFATIGVGSSNCPRWRVRVLRCSDFRYFIAGGGGCDDPRLVQLRATPSCRIGRFESGTLIETSGLIEVDVTV
jgi:hypothetical protein